MMMHGSILPCIYSILGLEKYNDIVTKTYFRSTSHKGTDALLQIMQKQNRLEYLTDAGVCKKMVLDIKCSNCKEKGHNKCTCLEKCAKCGHQPYKTHLIKIQGRSVAECEQENDNTIV